MIRSQGKRLGCWLPACLPGLGWGHCLARPVGVAGLACAGEGNERVLCSRTLDLTTRFQAAIPCPFAMGLFSR